MLSKKKSQCLWAFCSGNIFGTFFAGSRCGFGGPKNKFNALWTSVFEFLGPCTGPAIGGSDSGWGQNRALNRAQQPFGRTGQQNMLGTEAAKTAHFGYINHVSGRGAASRLVARRCFYAKNS